MHCDAVGPSIGIGGRAAGILPSFLQSFAVDNRSLRVFLKGYTRLFTHFRNLIVLSNDQKISTLKF